MAYLTAELVTRSWFLSGIVSRELQVPTGDQITEGLDLLNEFLALRSVDIKAIPYYTEFNLPAVIGQEGYFIEDLLDVETFTFNIGSVRYSTMNVPRRTYVGSGRADNIQSLPFSWHLERELGGASIFLYFKPSETFPLTIHGKFALGSVTIDQDLELTLDKFYIAYLRYALANQMCSEYNLPFQSMDEYKKYEKMVNSVSPQDMTMSKVSTLQRQHGMNYAQVSIGKAFTPQ